jgi:predicted nuclease of predicted toxin-antitoxin system
LYLDDCAYSKSLAAALATAGHTVTTPNQAGLSGEDDEIHFRYAVQHDLILLTRDPDDFIVLHEGNPRHPGLLLIRQDNDITRDMSDADVVAAIASLEAAYSQTGQTLANTWHELSRWRPQRPTRRAGKGRPRK